MKVLILSGIYPTPDNHSGGIFITRRCRELKKNNINYKLITVNSEDSIFVKVIKRAFNKKVQSINETLVINGVEWNNILYHKTLFGLIHEKMKLNHLILNRVNCIEAKLNLKEYNLMHAHWAFPEGCIARKIKEKYGIPYVLTVHGSDIHTIPYKNERIRKYVLDALEHANKVIFVSNKLLEMAKILGYSGENAVVIPNGIDTEMFNISNTIKIKQELGFNNKVVGFIGNLVEVKRADKLPEIFEYIAQMDNNVEFLVVGGGNLKDTIVKKCNEKNLKVKFTGRVNPEEVPYYMNAIDVMILPSRNEAFGCVILEANACGVIAIGSSNGGIIEAIGNDELVVAEGKNFEKRFSEKVLEHVNRLYDKNELRDRTLKYSWSEIIKNEIEIYNNILK